MESSDNLGTVLRLLQREELRREQKKNERYRCPICDGEWADEKAYIQHLEIEERVLQREKERCLREEVSSQ
jgi:uncharacterized C2H2 Zn-finger protein